MSWDPQGRFASAPPNYLGGLGYESYSSWIDQTQSFLNQCGKSHSTMMAQGTRLLYFNTEMFITLTHET
jgi:hypothetical protein